MKIYHCTFVFLVILFNSCNHSFFISQSKIIYEETGYLMILQSQILFIQNKDSVINVSAILNKAGRDCMRLGNMQSESVEAYKAIAEKFVVEVNGQEVENVQDTLYLLYTGIKGFPQIQFENEITSRSLPIIYGDKLFQVAPKKWNYDIIYLRPLLLEDIINYKQQMSKIH